MGWRPGHLEPLGWIWSSPGFCDEKIWLFEARELEASAQSLETDEVLEIERLPLDEAIARAADGRIVDSKTVSCLLRAQARRSRTAAIEEIAKSGVKSR